MIICLHTAVHINDVHNAFCQENDMVKIEGVPMINFSKWARLHVYLQDVFRRKPPDVSEYRQSQAGVLTYLENELRNITVDSSTKKSLEEQSCKLQEQEEFTRRLKAVGMN